MKKCKIVIKDFVNVKFEGLDQEVRQKISKNLRYMVPYARHTPQFKLKRWDGMVAFATIGGATYVNLLDKALPFVIDAGYEIEIEDLRPKKQFDFPEIDEYYLSDYTWAKGHIFEGEPVVLMDHQVELVNAFLKNHQSLVSAATSAGKSICTACCSRIIEQTTGGRTITIVPSITLVRQTEVDYLNVGLDTGVYFGEHKDYDNQHILTTWQSMVALAKAAKNNKDAYERLNRILKNVDMVMVDEVHCLKGQELRDLLCGALAHIPIRWGLTGTIPKDEFSFASLLTSIGDVVYTISAKELQDKGLISNCHIDIMRLVDDHVEFSDYESEKEFLDYDSERVDWILNYCIELSKKGNTLVLVDSLDLGKKLSKKVPGSFFIYGGVKNQKRIEEFKKMSSQDNNLLFASFQTSSTGVSAVRIFNLVLISAGKSFTRCIQSIGRGLRKGGDKNHVNIFDFTSTLKFSSRQLSVRKTYYKEAQYPFTEHKIKYR